MCRSVGEERCGFTVHVWSLKAADVVGETSSNMELDVRRIDVSCLSQTGPNSLLYLDWYNKVLLHGLPGVRVEVCLQQH